MDSHRPNDSHQPNHPEHLMTALPKNDAQSSVESSHKFPSATATQKEHAFLVLPNNDAQSQKPVESSHKFPSAAATQKEHAFLVLPKNYAQSRKPVESSHKFPSAAATQKEHAFLVLPKNDAQSRKPVESSHKFPSAAATQEHAFLVLPKNDAQSRKPVESSHKFPSAAATQEHAFLVLPKNDAQSRKPVESSHKFPSAAATQKEHASRHESTTPTDEYLSSSGDELEYSRSRGVLKFSFEAVSGPSCCCPLTVTSACNCGYTTRSVSCGAEIFCPPPICDLLCKKPPSCHHSAGHDPHRCHFGACPPCKEVCGKKLADCFHFCPASCHEAIVTKVRDARRCSGPLEGNPIVVTLPCPPCTLHKMVKSKSPITRLMERGTKNGYVPCYNMTAIQGPSHKPTFTFDVTAEGLVAEGRGTTKQKAKHAAAALLLNTLLPLDTLPPAKKRKIGTEYDAHSESDVDANDNNSALPKGSAQN